MNINKITYDDDWIRKNWTGKCTKEFTRKYCEFTRQNISQETLRKHTRKMSDLTFSDFNSWTDEMNSWLIENYAKLGSKKSVKAFKEKFEVTYTDKSIQYHATVDLGLRVDRIVAYRNRHKLHDKQDDKPASEYEIRFSAEGYPTILINGRWYPYRKYLWERANGKVKDDYAVTYLGDPNDYSLDNLVCVPKNWILLLTSHKLRAENRTITKCGIKWCELYYLVRNEKLHKGHEKSSN
jgi:hypothetical protein